MSQVNGRFDLDFSSHSCRIRIQGTKPGKHVKVLVKDREHPNDPPLHGTGVLSDDLKLFTASFTGPEGEQTIVFDSPSLQAELRKYPSFD
jgi:hypothetical protein